VTGDDRSSAELEGTIADLHCHYPMHLPETATPPRDEVPFEEMQGFEDAFPHTPPPSLVKRIRKRAGWVNRLRARLLTWAAHKINEPRHDHPDEEGPPHWRVDLPRLRSGNVRFVFSVLYQPFAEIDLGRWPEGPPESGYITALTDQLTAVETELDGLDPSGQQHKVIRSAADLKAARKGGQTAFIHCVEGGFHLGPTEHEVRANVDTLADAGVAYITLAHLFFRQIAKNTPALPFLSDFRYRLLFWQWGGRRGLTKLGRAAVAQMYERRILIDISHMRQDAVDEVFRVLEDLDEKSGREPTDYPVIATHIGFRLGELDYNLNEETVKKIAARDGVIGLIFSQHLMNEGVRDTETETIDDSMDVLERHIHAISTHAKGFRNVALGSDIDGFIKPTLSGFENIDDLAELVPRMRKLYPEHAQAILSGNALRVLETVFEHR
jgi:microsomal dipeptidase-like Zn-dependent dipeptidase